MQAKKFELDSATVQLLRTLKARTGLTHQYLCRMALMLSIEEPGLPKPELYDRGGPEFNRYTLTGEWDSMFVAYLREWLSGVETGDYDEAEWFCAHINRGLVLLTGRVRQLDDVVALVPASV